ncbi:DUF433 domain-containing protein [Mesorhizobium sp. M1050]|uniref:DUF433 domain-containing protein n=1 Tax=Mesorhizobium sp. M1050 TaxID=2957051 RepID=UPI003338F423
MAKLDSNTVIAAFTIDQTARLTGVSKRQLGTWDRDQFFVPSIIYGGDRRTYSRLYSFRDLLSLKVLNQLRNETRITLSHLKEVKGDLAHLGDDMWVKSTLYVLGKRVVIRGDDETLQEAGSGQAVLQIPLRVVVGTLREQVQAMNKRDSDDIGKFDRHRGVANNQVVIAGTRIPVRSVKAFHDAGYSVEDIKREYPTLTEADIAAAIKYDAAA